MSTTDVNRSTIDQQNLGTFRKLSLTSTIDQQNVGTFRKMSLISTVVQQNLGTFRKLSLVTKSRYVQFYVNRLTSAIDVNH